jgi:hypothetical protein
VWGIDNAVANFVCALLAILVFGNIGLGIFVFWISLHYAYVGLALFFITCLIYIAGIIHNEWRGFCSFVLIFYMTGIIIGYLIF